VKVSLRPEMSLTCDTWSMILGLVRFVADLRVLVVSSI
jgi:hypothetical protein